MSENDNDVPDLESQADNHSMEQISPITSIIGSDNVEDSAVTDTDNPNASPSSSPAEPSSNIEGPNDQDQVQPIRLSQDVEEPPVVATTSVRGSTHEDTGNDQPFEALCTKDELRDFNDQVNNRKAPRARGIIGDAALRTMPWKTDDLPNYKDQVHPFPRESEQADAHCTALAAAPPRPANTNKVEPDFQDLGQHVPRPENTEDPTVVIENPIAEAEALPVTVIPMADVVHVANSPPQDTTVVRWHQEVAIRRYTVYLLLLIVVVLAAVTVGSVCGSGKCSRESPGAKEAPAPTPGSTSAAASARTAAVTAYINNITLTNKTIAYPPVSLAGLVPAEEQALEWLIESDPLNLTASDPFRLQQRYALLTFWFTNAPNSGWTNNTGWLMTDDECNWFGITCMDVVVAGAGKMMSVVERIMLSSNNIRGGIPLDLGLLQHLKTVDLSGNSLSGSLPVSIAHWSNLKWFIVNANALTGTLPDSIGLLQNLTDINLSYNLFSGSLPESIGQWINLKTFITSGNRLNGALTGGFNGTLPDSIGQWTALETFNTWYNSMTGTLPASIGQWTALTNFYIDNNSHNGTLPDSIGNWSKLDNVYLSNNALTGTIPKSIENWKNISRAYFNNNNFTGTMPTGICNAIAIGFGGVLSAACSLICSCCTRCY
jgi:Leucine-rich repeat (LRR) protein